MGCNSSSAKSPEQASGGDGGASGGSGDRAKDKKAAKEENKSLVQTMDFIGKVALFKRLPKDQHPLLAGELQQVTFKTKDLVIKQGDMGTEFFVIRSGEASVSVSVDGAPEKAVAKLVAGDYFGEMALLRDEPRAATIRAETQLLCFKMDRSKFQELGLNEKLVFANRKAVGGGARQIDTKPPSAKTPAELELLKGALKANENLQSMVPLDEARVGQLAEIAWKEEVPAGKDIISEGDLTADFFYVVQEGSFDIFVSDQEEGGDAMAKLESSKLVSTASKGGSFGELALLYLVPRAATVKAKEASVVWVIDRVNFKNILMKVSKAKIDEYIKYLESVKELSPLLKDEKKELAKALVEMHFAKGEIILQQGEPGNTFYILYDGEVVVTKDGVNQPPLKATAASAQFFGERALLNNEPRAATVTVESNTAKALALDRDSFDMLLGPLEDIIKRQADPARQSMAGGPGAGGVRGSKQPGVPSSSAAAPKERIDRKELSKIGLLGCGGFGAVELYEHKKSGETYAMKGLSKGYVVKTGMQESVMNEKNILMMTNSDFVIKLFETFNSSQTLYFLLEPALGGELYATYNRKGLHGSERHAMFYSAGVVYAFEHLHERRIIYRDLKPENLLLTDTGRIKLTDMGLAKFVIGKTYTTCGTPDYFAPELIASEGHTNAVDWWTLGILIFELMSGHPPFESAYPMQIYSKVMKGVGKLQFPAKCQGAVGDLIRALLKREPSERLPMKQGGTKNLMGHKWYGSFVWDAMRVMGLEPPYKPVVKSKKDIANFSARKEDMPKQLEYRDDGTGWDRDFAT